MKKIFWISSISLIVTLFGCQNDGNIGRLYGTWRVDSYTVNDSSVVDLLVDSEFNIPLSHVTFSFQNNIVNVVTVLDKYQNYYSQFGTWNEDGSTFTLDFTHVDAETPQGTGQYSAPKWLGMISDYPMVMTVSENKKDSFTLTWTDPDGNVKTYKLHKTW